MARVILSCSITKEQDDFLAKSGLSASKLLQRAIDEENKLNSGEILESNASLNAKVERLAATIQGYADFLTKNGLMEKFLQNEK